MTRRCVPDELYGRLNRRLDDLKRRIDEETIPLQRAINDIQFLIEGKTFQPHIINCDEDPFLPEGWKVDNHKKGGQLEWDPAKVRLHLSPNQQNGKSIRGDELYKELENEPVLNANVLDYLLAHQELIPDEWKGKYVFFWGTIYRFSGGRLGIRCLYWNDDRWYWDSFWLGYDFYGSDPAALSASIS